MVLCWYANHDHQAWPSLNTIADQTELNRRTVMRKLILLEEKGLITRTQRPPDPDDPTDEWSSTVYTLPLPALTTERGGRGTPPPPLGAQGHYPRGTPPPDKLPDRSIGKITPAAGAREELPADWTPDPAAQATAATRYPNLDLTHETLAFRSHIRAHGKSFPDWTEAWFGWLAKSETFRLRDRGDGSKRTASRAARSQSRSAENSRRADAALARIASLSAQDPGEY